MRIDLERTRRLTFDGDGAPVRAASGVAPYRDGHLVVQDDATHAAWLRPASVERVRVLPPVDGHDVFAEADGTKHLKPDLEAAVALGDGRVLLLGSGSTPARTRLALVGAPDGDAVVRDLPDLYAAVGSLLSTPDGALNLEGACLVGGRLRWFRRGAAELPSASVDVDLSALLAAVSGTASAAEVGLHDPLTYDLGEADGVALAVTDAVTLPHGRVLVSTAAEDTDDHVEDGPVVGSGLALLEGERVVASATLPEPGGVVHKVEGLALLGQGRLLAVVDDDDAEAASSELVLRVRLDSSR